ncbi:MAG: mechanosensitive ion channel [Xanthobacteraceae bacterium]|nr:mechanosensitive ion channel [Xanthobacteraceae bacterium]
MSRQVSPFIVAALLLLAGPALAQNGAKPAPAPQASGEALTPEQARRALETLQDDAKRAQMIETLRAIAKTAPAPADAASVAPDTAAPAAKPAADKPAADKPALTLDADSLGAQLLLTISGWISQATREVTDAARSVTHVPSLWYWLVNTATDPFYYQVLLDIAWKFVLVFGCAFAVEWLMLWALRRPLRALEARIPRVIKAPAPEPEPPPSAAGPAREAGRRRRRLRLARLWQSLLRLPYVLARLGLELVPVLVFVAVASLMLDTQIGGVMMTRVVILAIINAYALCRGLVCAARALVGPLGMFPTREETAAYVEVWTRRIVTVGISGITFANVALLLGLNRVGYGALLRLAMLAVHLLLVVVILQCRAPVARAIRAGRGSQGAVASMRNRIAGVWHYAAIFLVLGLWAVWALNIRDGYTLLLQYVVGTIVVVVAARLLLVVLLGLIDRGFRINADVLQRFPGLETRANRYLPLLRRLAGWAVTALAVVVLLQVWGADTLVWFYGSQIGSRLLSAIVTIGIAVGAAVAIWEAVNAMTDRQLAALTRDGEAARAARLRTFLPMLRTALLCIILSVVALTALSEIGINIAPLLAGAGIIGIAVGFGSQRLVQDVITGLFLLLENVVQVGDVVTVSGLTGTVENVSIRTIRLRASDGAVHIVPFSSVTSVTNASRGAGNAAVNVSVSYKEDTDRVGQVLKDIVKGMREEAEFKPLIRGDLELWGVDKVDGGTATLAGQIRCTHGGRWPVQREFNRRMKLRFQDEGIELASNASTLVVQAPLPVEIETPPPQRRAAE